MAKAFGFSEDDAKRVAAATRRIEGMPQGNRPRSRQYPVPTQIPGLVPFVMSTPNAYWRNARGEPPGDEPENPYAAKKVLSTNSDVSQLTLADEEVTIKFDVFTGVHVCQEDASHLSNVLWCRRLFGDWYAVSSGAWFWAEAVAEGDFASGTGATFTGQVQLHADGPVVDVVSDDSIADGAVCAVSFDDQQQRFWATRQRCPVRPPEE